jgi:hypothetical protein
LRVAGGVLGALLVCATVDAQESGSLLPVIPSPSKGERCVEPTDLIRREHMRFLLHQRDETVHRGIRDTRHSLVGCIDCHVQYDASGTPVPIDAAGQFCASCHSFAGIDMDCFECHAAVPVAGATRAASSRRTTALADTAVDPKSRGPH